MSAQTQAAPAMNLLSFKRYLSVRCASIAIGIFARAG